MPWGRQRVSLPRRCSLLSSISSWINEKLCKISTAAAAGSAWWGVSSNRFGCRRRFQRPDAFALGFGSGIRTDPAKMVADHLVEGIILINFGQLLPLI